MRKKAANEKERQSFWSEENLKVVGSSEQFGQKYYKVSDRDYRGQGYTYQIDVTEVKANLTRYCRGYRGQG